MKSPVTLEHLMSLHISAKELQHLIARNEQERANPDVTAPYLRTLEIQRTVYQERWNAIAAVLQHFGVDML